MAYHLSVVEILDEINQQDTPPSLNPHTPQMTITHATVGYGDVTLPQHWRLIGGVEGLVGALMVGWSVAVLVAVLQRLRGMSG